MSTYAAQKRSLAHQQTGKLGDSYSGQKNRSTTSAHHPNTSPKLLLETAAYFPLYRNLSRIGICFPHIPSTSPHTGRVQPMLRMPSDARPTRGVGHDRATIALTLRNLDRRCQHSVGFLRLRLLRPYRRHLRTELHPPLGATPSGPLVSPSVLRLAAGVCSQECAQFLAAYGLRLTAHSPQLNSPSAAAPPRSSSARRSQVHRHRTRFSS